VRRLDPNLVLAAAAVAIVATEAAYRTWISDAWLLLEALVAAVALVHAWREQDRLRLGPVLAVIGGLQLALFGVHVALDVTGDKDSSVVYRWQGNALRRGDYPRSEYPLGAVLLFGLEAWLGGGVTRNANALLMAPLAMVASAAVWLTRVPYAPWLAALIGFWPANAFYWQYKFDLAPAALLAVGLLLARRGRWGLAGVVLAAGALVKWTPALAVIALVAWLLTTRRVREAMTHAAAFGATIALVYVPFLVWRPSEALAAYERQSGRSITPESVWYLLLRPFDLAHVRTHISFSAGAPTWANVAAGLLQAAVVLAVVVAAARARTPRAAIGLAALAPVAFLLTNRIFSPQFVLVAFAGWAFAAALVLRTRREQLLVGVAMAAAALANEFVYPFALPRYDLTWPLCSLVFFGVGCALTLWLARRASSLGSDVVLRAERNS
jgi:Glycosyltransferase family 87